MTDTNTYQAQADELSQKLWAIANDLRGQMDARLQSLKMMRINSAWKISKKRSMIW